jgi:hypothetical protein
MPSSLTLQRCEDVVKRALNREELLAGLELRNLDEEFPRISFSEEVYGHALPKAA